MNNKVISIIASSVSDRSYYIRLNDGRLVMMDMGVVNLTKQNVNWQRLFEDFVKELQSVCQSEIITVAALFITHPHDDHVNLLQNLKKCGLARYFKFEKIIRHFPPKSWTPRNNWEKPEYPDLIEGILQEMARNGTEIITPKRGMTMDIDHCRFEILLTPDQVKGEAKDLNYFSLLIRQTVGNKKILWTGDMSNSLSETALELYGDSLKCDILQIPHHGTPNCGVLNFFETCNAEHHLWTIARQTFLDPEYAFAYGKYDIPTAIYDMQAKKVFCGGEAITKIELLI